jgi:hypothetical protein
MKTAAILLATLVLSACATAPPLKIVPAPYRPTDWGPASLRLQLGMTEAQALAVIGYEPNRAEVRTCGATSGSGPWTCRVLYYGSSPHVLSVFFSQSVVDGSWVVNNWNVY